VGGKGKKKVTQKRRKESEYAGVNNTNCDRRALNRPKNRMGRERRENGEKGKKKTEKQDQRWSKMHGPPVQSGYGHNNVQKGVGEKEGV